MSVFKHPHLTRGVVKTPRGAFVVARGLVEMPDEIGEELGWPRVDDDADTAADAGASAPHTGHTLNVKPSTAERRARA
jgi:hypothetical protein